MPFLILSRLILETTSKASIEKSRFKDSACELHSQTILNAQGIMYTFPFH